MTQQFQISSDKPTLSNLPCEIQLKIAQFLDQYDASNLARTSKVLTEISLRRIYATVVVDTAYSQFHTELPRYTYVNSSYNFKKLLRSKERKRIGAFHVIRLPSMLDAHNMDLGIAITEFLSELSSLTVLEWQAESFSLLHLLAVPNKSIVDSLELRLDSSPLDHLKHWKHFKSTDLHFSGIHRVHIRPFLSSDQLYELLSLILGRVLTSISLESLQLARYEEPRRLYFNSIFADLDAGIRPEISILQNTPDFETNTISTLFTSNFARSFASLSRLCLKNIIVSENDAHLLLESSVLPHLRTLGLKDVWEFAGSHAQAHENFKDVGFLMSITPLLKNLAYLELDYNEWHRDTVAEFIRSIPSLTGLYVWIHTNKWKVANLNLNELFDSYATAIARHSGLQQLAVQMDYGYAHNIQFTIPSSLFSTMQKLPYLTYLRLNLWRDIQNPELKETFKNLGNLRFLDVGDEPPSMLMTSHVHSFAIWDRVPKILLDFCVKQPNLKYVKIGRHVFEIKDGNLQERENLTRWFEEQVSI